MIMELAAIAIKTAERSELQQECTRLGIAIGNEFGFFKSTTLRRLLGQHNKQCLHTQQWTDLAVQLFGQEHGLNAHTLNGLIDGIHGRLYRRLASSGFVTPNPGEQGTWFPDKNGKWPRLVLITGQYDTRNVSTLICNMRGSASEAQLGVSSTLFAASLAFPDVRQVYDARDAAFKKAN